ncbi:OLC1v1013667C1 [Oldenlandia corymbosa var. corymbosa]|uniref:OLC1v1013667C1 n=1 Tax=Oldenlandia corymbosa var. corymbosa TaxID=529605 RepID=A0AAV1E235_OLDCO|nr:OLC1v1013667C1 [Oldenlandia corymbosa var. corymbosa]
MKKNSSKDSQHNRKSPINNNKQLHQKFENIEQEWDTYKRVGKRPKSHHLLTRSSSTGEGRRRIRRSSSSIISSLQDQILENSPRSLMSSLQESSTRRKSPLSDEGSIWKVRNNDIAYQEIMKERRAVLESGKLKGRRLFDDQGSLSSPSSKEKEEEMICGECFDYLLYNQEISCEVESLRSYVSDNDHEEHGGNESSPPKGSSCLNSSVGDIGHDDEEESEENLSLIEGEKKVEENDDIVKEEKGSSVVDFGANFLGVKKIGWGRWMPNVRAWLIAAVTMVFTVGLISLRIYINGGNFGEDEFLIPT